MNTALEMSELSVSHVSSDLEWLFAQCFYSDYRTVLRGGGAEPVYCPASDSSADHLLIYRADYFASALHEVAHWCIAGAGRRRLPDWGYWYLPDGRSDAQQRVFEQVEAPVQGLEWIFARAAGVEFRVSSDNLAAAGELQNRVFANTVAAQARAWCVGGLPVRARDFADTLWAYYGSDDPYRPDDYRAQTLAQFRVLGQRC